MIVENGLKLSGLYVLTSTWRAGRGVYVRVDFEERKIKADMCLSWHGLYRHWWVQPCSFIGNNGGVAWLEEDARCPYDGHSWRRGGTDELMTKTFVTNNNCIQYGKEYNGTLVDNNLSNIQRTDTPFECQGLCWNMSGCVAFSWTGANTPCMMYSKLDSFKYNNDSVSGMATCKTKGNERF